MAGGIAFSRDKLQDLVLYLSEASADDEGFGMVKLNKLLYRVDSEAYRLLGSSITGATYEKQEYGPVARMLPIVLDDLASNGYIIWKRIPAGPFTRKVPTSNTSLRSDAFADEERAIIDQALEDLRAHGGKSASNWSHHESAGWRVAEIGDEIPYETTLISSSKPPAHAVEELRQRVLSGNWE